MQTAPHSTNSPLPTFRLARFFSLTSLIGIVIVTACLFWEFRELTLRHLVEHESRANAALAHEFANTVWDKYRNFVLKSAGRTNEQLISDPAQAMLRKDVIAKMNGLDVVKIKIFNRGGLTVFSSDPSQIGEDKSKYEGFRKALTGTVVSQISYRNKFDAFADTLSNRNLISSYVPITAPTGDRSEGVIEIYSDVTKLLRHQTAAQWEVAGIVLTLLGTLYVFLLLLVRKADRIIESQEVERKTKEDQIRHLAYHDELTGLPNRKYFSERLDESVALATRHGHDGALMFIDLDRFKIVNDSLGHHAGDALLKAVAIRIKSCLRGSDSLFRMGGDEFTVILPRVEKPEDADIVAQRILEAVAQPIQIEESDIISSATLGIALFPSDGDESELLLRNADAAMYNAKGSARGTHAFYRNDMNRRAQYRLDLEANLRHGFANGEFELYYQPRLDTQSGKVVAVEALLRWINPARGVALPADFLSVLEDTGMIKEVGEWVLRSACAQLSLWHRGDKKSLRVSVNVSPVQLKDPAFIEMVEQVLRETDTPANLVELELSESVLISNADEARSTIESLRALGVLISIDNFGTAYSSLSFLRQFTVDYLKIDGSFVAELESNERSRAVAKSIVDLAQALNIEVVAEGVENQAQAQFLSEIRCAEMQGFLFCKPLPIEELQESGKLSNARPQGLRPCVP